MTLFPTPSLYLHSLCALEFPMIPPVRSLCSSSLDSGLLMDMLSSTIFRSDVVPVSSWSFKRPCMFLFFFLSLSQTPAQPQVQSSLLADETHMDQSAPLSQPTANHDLKAEPPNCPVSDHGRTMFSLDQLQPEPPSRSQPKLPSHCIKN